MSAKKCKRVRKNVKGKGIGEIGSRGYGDNEQRFGTENDGVLGVPLGHAVEEGWASGLAPKWEGPRGSRICGKYRTYKRAFSDLWQWLDLRGDFLQVWQLKGLGRE